MEFQKIFGDPEPQPDWYGVINFTLAVYLDCKWHQYKYSLEISEEFEEKKAKWCSKTPDPGKTVAKPFAASAESKPGNKPLESKPVDKEKPEEKPPEPKPAEEPPPEGEKPKKIIGYTKDPPPPPQNSVVDDFCFYSATRLLPTSARVKIIDPLRLPHKIIWAELTFLRWLHGFPPRIVFLRPSRFYAQYRFQDFSFWLPPPPPELPRKRLRFRPVVP